MIERLRTSPLPLYDLPPTWGGKRMLAGHSFEHSTGRLRSATLLATGGSAGAGRQQLRVRVSERQLRPVERELLAEDLVRAGDEGRPPTEPPEAYLAWDHSTKEDARQLASTDWPQATIVVDGEEVAFEHLVRGESWIATGQVGTWTVTLLGQQLALDAVELQGVTDFSRYVA